MSSYAVNMWFHYILRYIVISIIDNLEDQQNQLLFDVSRGYEYMRTGLPLNFFQIGNL